MKYDDSKSQLFDEALILDGQGNVIISSKLLHTNKKGTEIDNNSLELLPYRSTQVLDVVKKRPKSPQLIQANENREILSILF